MELAENLFHYKAEQSKYSIKPEDYGKKPLFLVDKDFVKYIERKMVAWYRQFQPKNDPDNVEQTQEGDTGMDKGAGDDADEDCE